MSVTDFLISVCVSSSMVQWNASDLVRASTVVLISSSCSGKVFSIFGFCINSSRIGNWSTLWSPVNVTFTPVSRVSIPCSCNPMLRSSCTALSMALDLISSGR